MFVAIMSAPATYNYTDNHAFAALFAAFFSSLSVGTMRLLETAFFAMDISIVRH